MYDIVHAGTDHRREEKDLNRGVLGSNPLLHLHLGEPPQVANQVHAGHRLPVSLVRGQRATPPFAGAQNESFMDNLEPKKL